MLATPSRGTRVPDPDAFAFEPKWDGFRAIARIEATGVDLWSRRGRPLAPAFPELAPSPSVSGTSVVLDGELLCFAPDGRPDFDRLRHRAVLGERAAARASVRHPA